MALSPHLESMLASLVGAAYIIGPSGRIVGWNEAATLLLGHPRERTLGATCCEVLASRDAHGNPYCSPRGCPVVNARDLAVPLAPMRLHVRTQAGRHLACAATFTVFGGAGSRAHILVQLHPRRVRGDPLRGARDDGAQASVLTRRERQILRLLARGASPDQIGQQLSIRPVTVRNHLRNVLRRLGARSRLEAVLLALRRGLIDLEQTGG